jgi:hypothetical protein
MRNSFIDHRRMRQAMALVLLSGTLLCIFPADHPLIRSWADNAVFVALGYLALGLFFFIINRTRLMMVCMGCSAAICFYFVETAPVAPVSKHSKETYRDSLNTSAPANYERQKEN